MDKVVRVRKLNHSELKSELIRNLGKKILLCNGCVVDLRHDDGNFLCESPYGEKYSFKADDQWYENIAAWSNDWE